MVGTRGWIWSLTVFSLVFVLNVYRLWNRLFYKVYIIVFDNFYGNIQFHLWIDVFALIDWYGLAITPKDTAR